MIQDLEMGKMERMRFIERSKASLFSKFLGSFKCSKLCLRESTKTLLDLSLFRDGSMDMEFIQQLMV